MATNLTAPQVAFLSSLKTNDMKSRMGRWTANTTTAMEARGFVTRTVGPHGFNRYALTGMGLLELDLATGTWEVDESN